MTTAPLLFDKIGIGYTAYRRPDPRIGVLIMKALGNAPSVVNVGAGAGSYEPRDRFVIAVEPSQTMVAQRPAGAAPVVRASAMALPLRDGSFAAAMGLLTIHHWTDRDQGISEMKRVACEKVVIFTWEPPDIPFWLTEDYLPHFLERDRKLFPPWWRNRADVMEVISVPVPKDCTDGFLCAYWCRPEAYLDTSVRNAISTFSTVGDFEDGLERLREDLKTGEWHRRNGRMLGETSIDFGYRIVVIAAD